MKPRSLIFIIAYFLPYVLGAQERIHTMSLDSTAQSPTATIEEISWLAGHWHSKGEDGFLEEVWLPAQEGAMLGSFRWIKEGEVNLYELLTISEQDSSLLLSLRHFDDQLHAWEEKGSPMTFGLVKIEERKAYFNNFTFESPSDDLLNVYVLFKYNNGSFEEKKFSYDRVKD